MKWNDAAMLYHDAIKEPAMKEWSFVRFLQDCCRNCKRPRAEHAEEKKCLYHETRFRPMGSLRAQMDHAESEGQIEELDEEMP